MEGNGLRKQRQEQIQRYVPTAENESIVISLLQVECVNYVRLNTMKSDIWKRRLQLIPGCAGMEEPRKGVRLTVKRVLNIILQNYERLRTVNGTPNSGMILKLGQNIVEDILLITKYDMPLKQANLQRVYVKCAETLECMHIMMIMISRWMSGGYAHSIME